MTHALCLTPKEVMLAAQVGVMRQIENAKVGRTYTYGSTEDHAWQNHIVGALGEYAAAKFFGVHWSGAFVFRASDLPGNVQVRTCAGRGRLILHREDADDDCFVLVRSVGVFSFEVAGWIVGREGKRPEFWTDPGTGRPAFFVPIEALNPVEGGKVPA